MLVAVHLNINLKTILIQLLTRFLLQPGKPDDILTICYTSGTTGFYLPILSLIQLNKTVSIIERTESIA